jgi:DNA-directed RNA polymerase specialized sigma24 family protein
VPGRETPVAPTHWSFGQLCCLVGEPSGYLRDLPAPLAGINLQHGLLSHRAELMKTLEAEDGRVELRRRGRRDSLRGKQGVPLGLHRLAPPVRDADGVETGTYEIPAGGRRYRALELLVKQKRLAKTAPVPCVVHEGGIAEEDSLAENIQRAPLHPLDQFRAFLALREKGQSEEEIAAAFFVSVAVVRQRLRLASVSPRHARKERERVDSEREQ